MTNFLKMPGIMDVLSKGTNLMSLISGIHVGLLAQKKLMSLGVFEEFATECEEIGITIKHRDEMKEELDILLEQLKER